VACFSLNWNEAFVCKPRKLLDLFILESLVLDLCRLPVLCRLLDLGIGVPVLRAWPIALAAANAFELTLAVCFTIMLV
jgi:hypothetical protein